MVTSSRDVLAKCIRKLDRLQARDCAPHSNAGRRDSGRLESRLCGSLLISTCCHEQELARVGNSLVNPFVFDASARELISVADRGLIEVTAMHVHLVGSEDLIGRLAFRRLR